MYDHSVPSTDSSRAVREGSCLLLADVCALSLQSEKNIKALLRAELSISDCEL